MLQSYPTASPADRAGPARKTSARTRAQPKPLMEAAVKSIRWAWLYLRLRKIYLGIKHDPRRTEYTDQAITPVTDDEIETHEMFKADAAQTYVSQERRLDKIRHGAAA